MNKRLKKKLKELNLQIPKKGEITKLDTTSFLLGIISKSEDINEKDEYGFTPLMHAVRCRSKKFVNLLLECDADVYIEDEWNETAIEIAIKDKNKEIVELFLNKANFDYFKLIRFAIEHYDLEMIKFLLEKAKEKEQNISRKIILQVIMFEKLDINNKIELIKYLIEIEKVDSNILNYYNDTLLMMAIKKNEDIRLIKLLLNYDIDPSWINNEGDTSLILACSNNREDIVELIIDKSDVNVVNKSGSTALIIAVNNNNLNLVKLLLDKGANINIRDESDETVLYKVVRNENLELLKLLLSYTQTNALITKNNPYGANPNVVNNLGLSPLYFAVNVENIEIIELLLSFGANLDNESIALAFKKNRTDIGLLLVDHLSNQVKKEEHTKKLTK